MKNLFAGCIALCLMVSGTAQPPFPDPDQICTENIESTWDGLGTVIPQSGLTGLPGQFCDSVYAPVGTYKYLIGGFNNTIPTSWADDNIYGIVGTGILNGIPGNQPLTATVLETRTSVIENQFQYYEDGAILTLNGGTWNLDRLYIDGASTLHVTGGATVEIKSVLHLENNGKLIVDPDCEVVLKHSATGQAIIDSDFGSIEGNITKEVYLSFDNYTAADQAAGDVLKFIISTNLGSINLDNLVRQIQDTLITLTVKPTVQVGWWAEIDPAQSYDYVANHSYHNNLTSNAALNTTLHQGDVVRDYNGFISNSLDSYYNPAVLYYQYDANYGVQVIPIYGNDDNTLESLLSSDQLTAIAAGVTTATEAEQDELATTPADMRVPLIVSVQNANHAINDMVLKVVGTWQTQPSVRITNISYDPDESPEYDGVSLSPYFENAATELNTPLSLTYLSDIYSRQGGHITDAYRNIDFTGFELLNQSDGSQVLMRQVVDYMKEYTPRSARSFYDIKPLVSFLPERVFVADPTTGLSYNALSGMTYPHKVADYLDFYDHTDDVWRTIDLYNIDGIEHSQAIGDTLEASDVIGLNHTNHYAIHDYDGSTLPLNNNNIKVDYNYTNMGGIANTVYQDTLIYADTPVKRSYDIKSDVYNLNVRRLHDFKESRGVDSYPCTGSDNCNFDVTALDDLNEFTLLRLNARTSADDTIALAYLPIAIGPEYVGGGLGYLDAFEYSIAPNPAMYLLRQEDGKVGELKFGSYSRNVSNPSDTLYLVVDFDALRFSLTGITVQEYFIDSPIGQHPNSQWPAWWNIKAKNPGQSTQRIDVPTFKMPVTNTANTYPRPNGVTGVEDFNGDLIELHIRPVYGDFNTDGGVTTSDMLLLLSQYGAAVNDNSQYLDYNNDGIIGQADLLAFLGSFGLNYPEDVYGSDDYLSPEQERISYLATKKDNNHIGYNWLNYSGFTPQQQAYLASCRLYGHIIITDEYGTVVYGKQVLSSADNNILLPSDAPTTAQLLASNTGNAAASAIGYRIYFISDYYLDLPGLTRPVSYLCLGCTNPGSTFTTQPIFLGY